MNQQDVELLAEAIARCMVRELRPALANELDDLVGDLLEETSVKLQTLATGLKDNRRTR